MKKTTMRILPLLFSLLLFLFSSCKATPDTDLLWEKAVYTENTSLGSGSTSFALEVKAGEKSVTFSVNTDREMLGEALSEIGLIEGEEGEFGLYIKVVNGIKADYDTDQSYWALCENGEMLMTSADLTPIQNGAHFELVYTK